MFNKKNITISLLCVISMVYFGHCGGGDTNLITTAKERVKLTLQFMIDAKVEGESKEQKAICMWSTGVVSPIKDPDALSRAMDSFDRWKKEGNMMSIDSYTVDNAWIKEGTSIPSVVVEGTINGSRFQMTVPQKKPLSWKELPKFE